MVAAGGVAQFAKGFGFYLTDALAGDFKILADLFQGVIFAIQQPKAEFQHLPFPVREHSQGIFHLHA